MKKTIDFYEFREAFLNGQYIQNFTTGGLIALFDYLEEYEQFSGEQIELDTTAIALDYSEYRTALEAMEQYQPDDMPTIEDSEGMDLIELQEEQEKEALEWLKDRTEVIEFGGGIIVRTF